MSQARDVLTALEPFRKRNSAANPYPIITTDKKKIQRQRENPEQIDPASWDLCRWYALSRISDKLLTLFPHGHNSVQIRQRQEQGQYYSDYFARLGFSQWGTDFRRDYAEADAYHFNVDRSYPLDASYESSLPDYERQNLDDLTLEERKELLIHRCFVTCAKDNIPGAMDRAPWWDRLSLPLTSAWYFQNGAPNTVDDPPAGGRE